MWCAGHLSASSVTNGSLSVTGDGLGDQGQRIERRAGQADGRGLAPGQGGDVGQHPRQARPGRRGCSARRSRPLSSASRWPAATSSTWTRLRPVSRKAGIRPCAASTMIRPVGVGLTSRGPIGVEGLTITTGRPARRPSLPPPFGHHLAALVGPDGLPRRQRQGLVRRPDRRRGRQGGDAAGIDDPLDPGGQGRVHHGAGSGKVVAHDLLGIARPEPVVGRDVEEVAHALHGRAMRASAISPIAISASRSFEVLARAGGPHQQPQPAARAASARNTAEPTKPDAPVTRVRSEALVMPFEARLGAVFSPCGRRCCQRMTDRAALADRRQGSNGEAADPSSDPCSRPPCRGRRVSPQ